MVLDFLLSGYKNGLSYRTLGVMRSAVSSVADIDGLPAGQHKLVCRFMKAVFNKRPAFPRYKSTWDPDLVLGHLRDLGSNDSLSLIALSRKTVVLMLLLSAQRGQTLLALDIRDMELVPGKVSFGIGRLLKTSRPGHHLQEVSFSEYGPDERLCVVRAVTEYLKRTADLRGNVTELFISSRSPYRQVSPDTLRRWTRDVLRGAGVDVSAFGPGSTRHAASSKVARICPIDVVMSAVGWTQCSTFAVFYNKPIQPRAFSEAMMVNV